MIYRSDWLRFTEQHILCVLTGFLSLPQYTSIKCYPAHPLLHIRHNTHAHYTRNRNCFISETYNLTIIIIKNNIRNKQLYYLYYFDCGWVVTNQRARFTPTPTTRWTWRDIRTEPGHDLSQPFQTFTIPTQLALFISLNSGKRKD